MITSFENHLNLAILSDEEKAVGAQINSEITSNLIYDNLPLDLTEFFYEEVNFDE